MDNLVGKSPSNFLVWVPLHLAGSIIATFLVFFHLSKSDCSPNSPRPAQNTGLKNSMASTASTLSLFTSLPVPSRKPQPTFPNSPSPRKLVCLRTPPIAAAKNPVNFGVAGLVGAGLVLTFIGPASAVNLPLVGELSEPANALSLPTWAVHVSSVAEWVTAMALVWQYGEKSGFETWKGLSWGMVPLLGGALCACTWHFFYNAESLEVLVALQAALTVIGNATMAIAAFRIFRESEERAKDL
ncbi:unnamed protein product [Linum tenue]|uniref:Ycf49-like protein n=1 Tax=Linum tenue TaxID=586396 RepID=A0AAV0PZM7_9ROSI|nr:unnamed protein product [Linum tenue]